MSRISIFAAAICMAAMTALMAACAPTAREAFGPRLDQARSEGLPMVIYAYGVPGAVAVGATGSAVPVYIQFVVTSSKPLERLQFLFIGNTTRGMPVRAVDGRIQAVLLKGPGPFAPGRNYEVNSFRVRPAGFPGRDVACVELVKVKLLYADGERKAFVNDALQQLLLPPLRGPCTDQGIQVYTLVGNH
ncbi:MAG: hypothetical protein L0I62_03385 [Gammaproteobacteria bacterium]|nr:hypothetical protein [Gammaproteobacteria bacterium]